MRGVISYIGRNRSLLVGTLILLALILFVAIGNLFVDTEDARALSVPSLRPPSWTYPFGTDRQGRDLFAVMVALIPFLARRIVTGEIGSSMMTVVHTVGAALGSFKGIPSSKKG